MKYGQDHKNIIFTLHSVCTKLCHVILINEYNNIFGGVAAVAKPCYFIKCGSTIHVTARYNVYLPVRVLSIMVLLVGLFLLVMGFRWENNVGIAFGRNFFTIFGSNLLASK